MISPLILGLGRWNHRKGQFYAIGEDSVSGGARTRAHSEFWCASWVDSLPRVRTELMGVRTAANRLRLDCLVALGQAFMGELERDEQVYSAPLFI